MKVRTVYHKGSGKVNEDALVVCKNIFAVIDGASSLVPWRSVNGQTGGTLATNIVKNTFTHGRGTLAELLKKANAEIATQMKNFKVNIKHKENRWCVGLAAVNIQGTMAEFISISDCLILTISKNGACKVLVKNFDHDIVSLRKWQRHAKERVPNIWNVLLSQFIQVRRKANVDYGVLNGERRAIKFAKHGKFSLENVHTIIIFTDGLMLPKENPDDPDDWRKFVEVYLKTGLNGLVGYVRRIQRSDPNCWKYPRFKKHDDIAAIAIDFLR